MRDPGRTVILVHPKDVINDREVERIDMGAYHPRARRDGLMIEDLSDEVIIYDTERQKAHSLNQAAALVWKHCDGRNGVAELAAILAAETSLPGDEAIVTDALGQLSARNLLVEDSEAHHGRPDRTRRDLLKQLGIMAALLPVVLSITAPTPSMAQSAAGPTGETGPTGPVDL